MVPGKLCYQPENVFIHQRGEGDRDSFDQGPFSDPRLRDLFHFKYCAWCFIASTSFPIERLLRTTFYSALQSLFFRNRRTGLLQFIKFSFYKYFLLVGKQLIVKIISVSHCSRFIYLIVGNTLVSHVSTCKLPCSVIIVWQTAVYI